MRFSVAAVAPAVLFLGLAACASAPGGSGYADDLRKLEEECAARGGILQARGEQTGRARTDNVCEIRGVSPLPRS